MNPVLDIFFRWARRAKRFCWCFVAGLLLALPGTSVYALDPLTLILLRLARDKLLSVGIESAAGRAKALTAPVPYNGTLPQTTLSDGQLRRLIDEGFMHLSFSQRGEVYDSVQRILADPANAADVPGIIADLALKASGVRQALESISRLSPERKR